ncbi:MAG: hypothetical protein ABIT37_24570 [Luteolibacter sp.]
MKLIAIIAALLAPVVHGKDGLVNCRFLGFEPTKDGIPTLVAQGKDGKLETIALTQGDTLSKSVVLKSEDGVITFRKAESDAAAATAKIPDGTMDVIVLFTATEKEGLVRETVVLDSSAKAFPPDGSIILNHCPQKAKVTVGDGVIEIKPDESVPLGRPKEIDDFNMASVKLELETAGVWRTVFESNVRFIKGQRSLFVAHVDPESKRPRFWMSQE